MQVEIRKRSSTFPSPKLKKFAVVGNPAVEMTPSSPGVMIPRATKVDSQKDQEQVAQVAVDQEPGDRAVVALAAGGQAVGPVAVAPAAAPWVAMGSPEVSVRRRPVRVSNSLPFSELKCLEWPVKSPRMLHFTRHTSSV